MLQYRLARVQDIPLLKGFASEAFTRTFGSRYRPEDLLTYLSGEYTDENFVRWISDPKYQLWVALDATVLHGYLLCGPCGLPLNENLENCGEIKKLYVLPSCFGSGVSNCLMNIGLAWLHKAFPGDLFLGVDAENFRAQKFYQRFGFHQVSEYRYQVGDWYDRELIYKQVQSPIAFRVGVLAIQGAVEEHISCIRRLGCEAIEVYTSTYTANHSAIVFIYLSCYV